MDDVMARASSQGQFVHFRIDTDFLLGVSVAWHLASHPAYDPPSPSQPNRLDEVERKEGVVDCPGL